MKKDFLESIEIQRLKKENTSLQNKLQMVEEKAKISSGNEKVSYKEIKLGSNIREDSDIEIIKELALSIIDKGQLQSILLTSDNYLIAGYRRYSAIKLLNNPDEILKNILEENHFGKKAPEHLVVYRLEIKYDELSHEEIDELQFIENEERRSLDNFDISSLFCKYESLGYKQEDIAKKFKKTKGFVSSLISLKKTDPYLIKLLREFQVYGISKDKFI
ncbi:MAG: ParB/RepB/Spo0J family partition protein, partial [Candidatus Sericytochromatia bacterium]